MRSRGRLARTQAMRFVFCARQGEPGLSTKSLSGPEPFHTPMWSTVWAGRRPPQPPPEQHVAQRAARPLCRARRWSLLSRHSQQSHRAGLSSPVTFSNFGSTRAKFDRLPSKLPTPDSGHIGLDRTDSAKFRPALAQSESIRTPRIRASFVPSRLLSDMSHERTAKRKGVMAQMLLQLAAFAAAMPSTRGAGRNAQVSHIC